ncbi:MAG: hypothetical protein HZC37_21025 [Burkholderiales bacterium]|nr:hypothetical protein [Burkholderiales bacterium]
MNDDKSSASAGTSETTSEARSHGPRVRLDRRALLRAGAGATPVLLTLASSPVSAANSCVVASSFVSVATFKSRNPTVTTVNCATRTTEDWRNACMSNTQLTCAKPLVSSTFGSTSSSYNSKTLRQVLCDPAGISSSGELGVLQHLIALNLSVTQGFMRMSAGNVSPAYLGAVWCNYKNNGNQYRLPSSTVVWSSTQLISWLRYQLNYSMPL